MVETLETLEREICGPKNLLDESKKELAEQCKKELNYPILSQTVKLDKTKIKFKKCMDKIGLRPFKEETVEKYKKEEGNRRWFDETKDKFKAAGVITAISVLFFCSWFTGWIVVSFVLTIIGILGMCMVLFGALPEIAGVRSEWWSDHLSSYTKPIPEYALQTAVDLQKELKAAGIDSECKFYVESLFVHRVARDPFLFVQCGSNRYYLEVWDEPNFGAEKLV